MPMLLMLKVILTVIKGRIRQWEWDVPDVGGGRLSSITAHWIHLVPGTAEDNGTWYRGSSVGTRSGRTISIGDNATFDETNLSLIHI